MMKNNFDFFMDYFVVQESKYAEDQLEFNLSKL